MQQENKRIGDLCIAAIVAIVGLIAGGPEGAFWSLAGYIGVDLIADLIRELKQIRVLHEDIKTLRPID